jgi:hypothetical protein
MPQTNAQCMESHPGGLAITATYKGQPGYYWREDYCRCAVDVVIKLAACQVYMYVPTDTSLGPDLRYSSTVAGSGYTKTVAGDKCLD